MVTRQHTRESASYWRTPHHTKLDIVTKLCALKDSRYHKNITLTALQMTRKEQLLSGRLTVHRHIDAAGHQATMPAARTLPDRSAISTEQLHNPAQTPVEHT